AGAYRHVVGEGALGAVAGRAAGAAVGGQQRVEEQAPAQLHPQRGQVGGGRCAGGGGGRAGQPRQRGQARGGQGQAQQQARPVATTASARAQSGSVHGIPHGTTANGALRSEERRVGEGGGSGRTH